MKKIKSLKIGFLAITLIFLSITLSIPSNTYATQSQQQGYNPVPGMPEDALQINRTDTTPNGQMEQIIANNMYVFQYRHMTILMNCSRNMVMNVTIDPQIQNRIFGVNIDPNQSCQLNMKISASPPEGVQTMTRTLNTYWEIEPNATIQFKAQLRLHINSSALNGELNRKVDTSKLQWMYWNRNQNSWVPVESSIDEDGYLTCETTHFSTWTVAENVSNASTIQTTTYIAIGIGVVALVGIFLLVKKR